MAKRAKVHSLDLLDLSSDLPIVIEIVDTDERIEELKRIFDKSNMIGSALITEEEVKIIQYGTKQ